MNMYWTRSLLLLGGLLSCFHDARCLAATTPATPPIQPPSALKIESIDESIDRMDELIRQHPNDALLYTSRAAYLNSAGIYDKALRDANRALELSSQSAEVHKQRALALGGMARWQDALGDADQYVKMASRSELAVAYGMRACLELRSDKFAAAIVDFNSAIQLNHGDAWLYLYRSWAFSGFGVYERTVKDCTKCLELIEGARNPSDCEGLALRTRAHAYEQLGQHELAQQDLKLQSQILDQHH